MGLPVDVKTRAAIGIGQRNRRHGVGQLRKRRIKGHFIAAEMIFVIDGAGLYGREPSRSKQGYSVALGIDYEFHGGGNHPLRMTQQFSSHLARKCDQRRGLLQSRLIVHQEDSLSGIGIRVGIAQGGVGVHGGSDRQTVKRHTVPATALNMPCQDRFVADEVNFTVGKALSSVDIGTSRFDVLTANLLAESRSRKSQKKNAEKLYAGCTA